MSPNSLTTPPKRSLRADFALAVLPTVTVLLVFALVDSVSRQKLLFASLASSAFLIYAAPRHATSRVRTVLVAQSLGALLGFGGHLLGGGQFWAAAMAMILAIFGMIWWRVMHPPAVSTALSFALGATAVRSVLLFGACVLLLVGLALAQQTLAGRIERAMNRETIGP